MRFIKRFASLLLVLILTSSFSVYAVNRKEVPLVTPPRKTTFYEGKDWGFSGSEIVEYSNFDLEGASVNYNDNIIKYAFFPWGANMYATPVSGKWVVGKNVIDIHVDDIESFNGDVYAVGEITLAAVKSVEITKYPRNMTLVEGVNWHYDKLGYIIPDNIDLTGLTIKINYTDSTSETLSYSSVTKDLIGCQIPSSTDRIVPGENRYLITYCTKSADIYFNFETEQISRAVVDTVPALKDYHYKTNWKYESSQISPQIDLSGLKVTAIYNSGKKETVSYDKSPARFSIKPSQKFYSGQSRCMVLLDNKFEFNIYINIYRYGDVDLDGFVNSSDALLVLRYAVSSTDFDSNQKFYGDVNKDSKINSTDALYILNYSVGSMTAFSAEK